ncbi:phospho-sugar mutase [bacterium]|nr:phospho-sugar mutase [candidate division CSSED10-310 bacterium]
MEWINTIEQALQQRKICRESYVNLRKWLTGVEYRDGKSQIEDLIRAENWTELDDCFYRIIEFGTGGRRGPRGVGPNRINLRTIGESAQGLAEYIEENGDPSKGVVVAFDTRHGSPEFAREVCRVLAGNGIPSFLYPDPRSTPQLSFSIRHLRTQAGCMISASHNPPADNGIKVSWEDGGQVVPPHDTGIIHKVSRVRSIHGMPFQEAVRGGMITILDESPDREYLSCLRSLSLSDARDAKIAFSPLHGVGQTNVVKLLESLNFDLVTVPGQMKPDPEFSTIKNQLPNPELPDALELVTHLAASTGAAVALASDPDADRLGAAVPCPASVNPSGWVFLTGNQIGVLILDHILKRLQSFGKMPRNPVLIKTIVTTEMMDALCAEAGVEVIKDLLVGFKYIAEQTAKLPPEKDLLFACEESHGYNRGMFVRDKDAAPAALYMAELASELKRTGGTIYGHLNALYRKYGYYCEETRSIYYPGKSGSETMMKIMDKLRRDPPGEIAGYRVRRIIDRSVNEIRDPGSREVIGHVKQHRGNVMIFHFDGQGVNRLTARPSGTEPKIKFYAQLRSPAPAGFSDEELEQLKSDMAIRAGRLIDAMSALES